MQVALCVAFYYDVTVTAVARGICAVIAEQIVSRRILLHSRENLAEVVRVEKSTAAGIAGQRHQRLLRGEIGVQRVERRLSRIRRNAAEAGVLRFSARHQRLQAAHVHSVNRQVGAHRRVHCRPQFRLILDAGAVHAAGKVDQRLLLLHVRQLFRHRAQRFQPPVGIEDVVFRIVGGKWLPRVGRPFGRSRGAFFEALAAARTECLQLFF